MPHSHGAGRMHQPLPELLAHLTGAEAPKQSEHSFVFCSAGLPLDASLFAQSCIDVLSAADTMSCNVSSCQP